MIEQADAVETALRRILRSGSLEAFPTHPKDLDAVLAVAAVTLMRRRPYSEQEINAALVEWLESVHGWMDHVTLRRRLVDLDFLKRTVNGSRYFMNYGRVVEVLGDPALELDAGAIVQEILRERKERKRMYTSGG
ncbi:MAG: DUF2087 domain-containing protein [Gammaproteobacteria bacterium]|nr:DUF2087 domain-containing protein [Gammaproteobacteria bacterium]MDE0366916.1 DUF2087 domain-containing protein [Gammaproteobacteria bacterium]